TVGNLHANNLPFLYNYSIAAANYAKLSGDLLLVRPRVIGSKASALLETKDPRQYPSTSPAPSAIQTSSRSRFPPPSNSTTCQPPSMRISVSPPTRARPKWSATPCATPERSRSNNSASRQTKPTN